MANQNDTGNDDVQLQPQSVASEQRSWPAPENSLFRGAVGESFFRENILRGALKGAAAAMHGALDVNNGTEWLKAQQRDFTEVCAEINRLLEPLLRKR